MAGWSFCLVPVALIAIANNFASQNVERRKQGGRPMPFVVVSHGAAASLFQGQSRLGTLEGLNLALLIHTQHHRLIGRIEIQADDVGELFQESGVA